MSEADESLDCRAFIKSLCRRFELNVEETQDYLESIGCEATVPGIVRCISVIVRGQESIDYDRHLGRLWDPRRAWSDTARLIETEVRNRWPNIKIEFVVWSINGFGQLQCLVQPRWWGDICFIRGIDPQMEALIEDIGGFIWEYNYSCNGEGEFGFKMRFDSYRWFLNHGQSVLPYLIFQGTACHEIDLTEAKGCQAGRRALSSYMASGVVHDLEKDLLTPEQAGEALALCDLRAAYNAFGMEAWESLDEVTYHRFEAAFHARLSQEGVDRLQFDPLDEEACPV